MMIVKRKLLATIGALLAGGVVGAAGLAHATPTPPPPSPTTSQSCDPPDAAEVGEDSEQPGGRDTDNVQDGDRGGPEIPDAPCE